MKYFFDYRIKKSFEIAEKYSGYENFRIVKYEQLVADTASIMNELADWLGIEYSDILLKPTILGQLWKGNSSVDNDFLGVSRSRIGNGLKKLNQYEKDYISDNCGKYLDEYNYV